MTGTRRIAAFAALLLASLAPTESPAQRSGRTAEVEDADAFRAALGPLHGTAVLTLDADAGLVRFSRGEDGTVRVESATVQATLDSADPTLPLSQRILGAALSSRPFDEEALRLGATPIDVAAASFVTSDLSGVVALYRVGNSDGSWFASEPGTMRPRELSLRFGEDRWTVRFAEWGGGAAEWFPARVEVARSETGVALWTTQTLARGENEESSESPAWVHGTGEGGPPAPP